MKMLTLMDIIIIVFVVVLSVANVKKKYFTKPHVFFVKIIFARVVLIIVMMQKDASIVISYENLLEFLSAMIAKRN